VCQYHVGGTERNPTHDLI